MTGGDVGIFFDDMQGRVDGLDEVCDLVGDKPLNITQLKALMSIIDMMDLTLRGNLQQISETTQQISDLEVRDG